MRQDDHLSALQPGAKLHSYTIVAILGAGGFGITYKAREDITARAVAIKEYLPTAFAIRDRDGATVRPISQGAAADFGWGLERFREEAKLLIDFRHPNIVPVLAYFEANGTGYLVMEFQDGISLGELLKQRGALTQAETLRTMVPLLDGIEEVHRRNFLHRDIKPENIFVRADGSPVLLDFGAARQALGEHSKSLTTLLTEGYSPFEQYAGTGNQGPWSDIYAIAGVMFRCLMGKPPIEAPRRAVAKLRGQPDPMAPDFAALRGVVSSDLAFAIEAGMRVVEHERPQTIAALREMILAPTPATLRLPERSAAVDPAPVTRRRDTAAPSPTLIPDVAQHVTGYHRPHRLLPRERPRRSGLARYGALAAGLLVMASAAAYVSENPKLLAGLMRPPETEAAAPPGEGPQPATTGEDWKAKQEAERRAQEERIRAEDARRTEELRRQADEEQQRRIEASRRAQVESVDEQDRRAKALAEYQRKLIEQSEAERRPYDPQRAAGAERRRGADGATVDPGQGSSQQDRYVLDAPQRAQPDARGAYENPPYEVPETRRYAPPISRRAMPPAPPQGYYPPELPGSRWRGTEWQSPGYIDDY